MKSIGIIAFVLFIFSSCSTSKQATQYRNSINGKWQLQTITVEGIAGTIKTKLFNEQDLQCFEGSSWSFNSNNSLGVYNIEKTSAECAPLKRNIRWSIYEPAGEPKQLQFKRLDNNLKEIDAGAGFRFVISQVDNNTMQLKSNITFEGKPASFIYNFVRK